MKLTGKKYIAGEDCIGKFLPPKWDKQTSEKELDIPIDTLIESDLLNDIIKLNQALPTCFLIYPNNIADFHNIDYVEKNYTEKDCKLILKFCEKHGLPFLGDWTRENYLGKVQYGINEYKYFGFENDYNTIYILDKHCFRLGCFLIGIQLIFDAFIYSLKLNETKIIMKNTDELDNVTATLQQYLKNFKKEINKENTYFFNTIINCMNLKLKTNINDSNLKLNSYTIYGETLLSCAVYQLLQFATSGNQKVATCAKCKNIFIIKRQNTMYCSGACKKRASRRKTKEIQ